MNKITVFCETNYKEKNLDNVSFELLSKAQELKAQARELKQDEKFIVEALIIADKINEDSIKKAYNAGADRVVLIKNLLFETFNSALFSKVCVDYLKTNPSNILLFAATVNGRAIAPRVTTMLDTGLVADCTALEFILKDGNLKLAPTRPTFGAELMATILSKKLPECATIRPKTFKINFNYPLEGEFVELNPDFQQDFKIKLLKLFIDNKEDIADFSNAKIVLAAGYGLVNGKDTTYIEKLQLLAKKVGAKFGSTRKLVDFGFAPRSSQIGQTGSTVACELYIAFGVSGAIQHICGMKNSKTIVSINTDENAEIFKYSDYKIVYDAKQLIDALLVD